MLVSIGRIVYWEMFVPYLFLLFFIFLDLFSFLLFLFWFLFLLLIKVTLNSFSKLDR